MGNSGDRLHFNGVHLLQRVVENTGGIDGLEAQVLVIEVTNEQGLGGESIGLDIDIGAGDVFQEAGLSDVGVTADQKSAGVGVDRGQTTQMLANLLQVDKRIFQATTDGGHATERSALQLLTLEQRMRIFDETDIIAGNGFDQVLGSRNLTEGDAEVVGVIEGVHQILV